MAASMRRWGAWHLWSIAVVQAAVLTVFSAIGGAIFEKRWDIGHEPLGQWLSLADERHIVADARKILGRVVEWNDREIAAPIGRMLLAELTRRGFPAAASEIRKFMQKVGA